MIRTVKRGLFPPAIANTVNGRYLIINGKWERVSKEFALEYVRTYDEKEEIKLNTYTVESDSFKGEKYTITQNGDEWKCTCMGYNRLKNKSGGCKHIRKIKEKHLC